MKMSGSLPMEGTGPLFQNALRELVDAHITEVSRVQLPHATSHGSDLRQPQPTIPVAMMAPQSMAKECGMATSLGASYDRVSSGATIDSAAPSRADSRQPSVHTHHTNGNPNEYVSRSRSEPIGQSISEHTAKKYPSKSTRTLKDWIRMDAMEAELALDSVVTQDDSAGVRQASMASLSTFARFRGDTQDLHLQPNRIQRLVHHAMFESTFAFLIILNACTIAAEVQYHGIDIGHDLAMKGYSQSAKEILPGFLDVLDHLNLVFGVLFTIELILKLAGLRFFFFRSPWNWFDMFVVGSWLLTESCDLRVVANPMMFRLFRLLRLVRLLRLIKSIQAMDALQILVTSIGKSLPILLWATIILLTMITMVALFMNDFVTPYIKDESNPMAKRQDVFLYFGTFYRAALSLLVATLGNFEPVMRVLMDNVNLAWGSFFAIYKMSGGYAVPSVILGVFLHETFRVANSDDHLMVIRQRRQKQQHMRKMAQLFQAADRFGTGEITREDFAEVLKDPFIMTWLSAYELDVHDATSLFELLDDGDGKVTAAELVAGVARLKGGARSIDLHTRMNEAMSDLSELKQLIYSMGRTLQFPDEVLAEGNEGGTSYEIKRELSGESIFMVEVKDAVNISGTASQRQCSEFANERDASGYDKFITQIGRVEI